MMKKEPPQIVEQELMGIAMGAYIPATNKIYIDKKLRRYPVLRSMVIAHEQEHAAHDRRLYDAWLTDLAWYPRFWMERQFHDYRKSKKSGLFEQCQGFGYVAGVVLWVLPLASVLYAYLLFRKAVER